MWFPLQLTRRKDWRKPLKPHVAGQRVLLRSCQSRSVELLREELAKVATVSQVAVYEQADIVEPDAGVLDALRRGEIRYVTLPSSNMRAACSVLLMKRFAGVLSEGKFVWWRSAQRPETRFATWAFRFPRKQKPSPKTV